MKTIHLQRQKVKKFKLEDKELMICVNSTTINHFQKSNKKGFLKLMEELQEAQERKEAPIFEIMQLLGSSVCYLTGQPVGIEFFKDYDDFMVLETLSPMLFELFNGNLPQPKNDTEKK